MSGEVWYSMFPKEEDHTDLMERPCIIVDQIEEEYLVIKVTKHDPRSSDQFDTPINDWRHCGLKRLSTARVSKVVLVKKEQILNYKGTLTPEDEQNITNQLEKFLSEQ